MDTPDDILRDIGNFLLVIFGFTATLFTVIYSLIINKREFLKEISDKIKIERINPILGQRKSNAIKYINTMKKINFHLIISLFASLFMFILTRFFIYYKIEYSTKRYVLIVIGFLTFLILLQILYILIATVRKYFKETKI